LATIFPATDSLRGVPLAQMMRQHAGRALRFGIISGIGLAIDLSLFVTLIHFQLGAFAANALSSATALTFVYCASVRRVFRYDGRFIVPMFAAYALYHLCGTLAVSSAIGGLVQLGATPILAKVGILPVTFTANFVFMSWLTRQRERWALRTGCGLVDRSSEQAAKRS
jgi:putative flippase GtrA